MTEKEIYNMLVKIYHPDKFGGEDVTVGKITKDINSMKSNKEQLVKFLDKIELRLRLEKDIIPFDNNSEVEKLRKEVKNLKKTNKEWQDTATQLLEKSEKLENENKKYSQIISNSKTNGHSIELEVAKDEIKKLQTTANMWKEKTNELSNKLEKTMNDNKNLKQMNIAWEDEIKKLLVKISFLEEENKKLKEVKK